MINFNKVVEIRLAKVRETLTAKADEYARGDRLSNFKTAAALQHITPEAALGGMVAKHLVALYDFIRDIDNGKVQPYGRWDEKIGDTIAYMCLLDGLVQERLFEGAMEGGRVIDATDMNIDEASDALDECPI